MKLDPTKMKDWEVAEAAEATLRPACDLLGELGIKEGEWEGSWALALEYIPGQSLAQVMRDNPDNTNEYLEQLVELRDICQTVIERRLRWAQYASMPTMGLNGTKGSEASCVAAHASAFALLTFWQ